MKIYKQLEPPNLIRVNIKRQGEETYHINLCECTSEEVFNWVKGIIEKESISPFVNGKVTNVEIREAKGGINGKSNSLSFKGINTQQTYILLTQNLTK